MALITGLISTFVIVGCHVSRPSIPYELMNGAGQPVEAYNTVALPSNISDQSIVNGFVLFGENVSIYDYSLRFKVQKAGLQINEVSGGWYYYTDPNGLTYYVWANQGNRTFGVYTLYNFSGSHLLDGYTDSTGAFPVVYSPLVTETTDFSDGGVLDSFSYIFQHPSMFSYNPSKVSSGWYRGEFIQRPVWFTDEFADFPSLYFNLARVANTFSLTLDSVGFQTADYQIRMRANVRQGGNSFVDTQIGCYSLLGSSVYFRPDGLMGLYVKPYHDTIDLPMSVDLSSNNFTNETDIGGSWWVLSCPYSLYFYDFPTAENYGGNLRLQFSSSKPSSLLESYYDGYDEGYSSGYFAGFNDGTANGEGGASGAFSLLRGAFNSLGNILSIEVLPNVPVSLLVTLPVAGALILWIIRILKGG